MVPEYCILPKFLQPLQWTHNNFLGDILGQSKTWPLLQNVQCILLCKNLGSLENIHFSVWKPKNREAQLPQSESGLSLYLGAGVSHSTVLFPLHLTPPPMFANAHLEERWLPRGLVATPALLTFSGERMQQQQQQQQSRESELDMFFIKSNQRSLYF